MPSPTSQGSLVNIFKQDPSVTVINVRTVLLCGAIANGPQDSRIRNARSKQVDRNVNGDFLFDPNEKENEFNDVQAFSVVRLTLTMVQRALKAAKLDHTLPWFWNSNDNSEPLSVFSMAGGRVVDSGYIRNSRAVKFLDFRDERKFACRSLDLVAHEVGHAILDSIQPKWFDSKLSPQSQALHESFGDLTAIFLSLSFMDVVEAIIAHTKANLRDSSFVTAIADEAGLMNGRANGIRNAVNGAKLSDASGDAHFISLVFTGAIYDSLVDVFELTRDHEKFDHAKVLYEASSYLYSLLLRSLVAAPKEGAAFADVVNIMIANAKLDGNAEYVRILAKNFSERDVNLEDQPIRVLAVQPESKAMSPGKVVSRKGKSKQEQQYLSNCCYTMKRKQ